MARLRSENPVTCQNNRCRYFNIDKGKNIIRRERNRAGNYRDTVGRLLEDLTENAEYVNETLLRSIPLKQCEINELWSMIKKTVNAFPYWRR